MMEPREALEITLMIFDYMAINGCDKTTAIKALGLSLRMLNHCALCSECGSDCDNCLILWPGSSPNNCNDSLYGDYCDCFFAGVIYDTIKSKAITRKIANLALAELNKRYPE